MAFQHPFLVIFFLCLFILALIGARLLAFSLSLLDLHPKNLAMGKCILFFPLLLLAVLLHLITKVF